MPSAIRNAKGFYAGASPVAILSSGTIRATQTALVDDPQWPGSIEARATIASLINAALDLPALLNWLPPSLQSSPSSGAPGMTSRGAFLPVGWCSDPQPFPLSPGDIHAQTRALISISDLIPALPSIQGIPDAAALAEEIFSSLPLLPSRASLQRMGSLSIQAFDSGTNAEAREARAVWMHAAHAWMGPSCRPGGISSARLFESLSSTQRSCLQSGFGDPSSRRGGCAIVRCSIEPVSVAAQSPGTDSSPILASIARREAELIASAARPGMDGFAETGFEASLAFAEEGFAFWSQSPDEEQSPSGFLNSKGIRGPLSGASLFPSVDKALFFGLRTHAFRGDWAIVKTRARPVQIEARIGFAPASAVERACSLELARAQLAAIDNASAPPPRSRPGPRL